MQQLTHQYEFDRRWEFGPRTVVCPNCKALMWIEERVKGSSKTHSRFYHCCQSGQVKLTLLPLTPPYLMSILPYQQFRNNIRAFNSMLAFTSMGSRIDNTVNDDRGPYVYRISGTNYHRIGTLLPELGTGPKFAQLYIYDTDNETSNRLQYMGATEASSLDPRILQGLQTMLDDINPYVAVFRNAGSMLRDQGEHQDLRIKLIRAREGRQYIQPTTSEVVALMVGDGTEDIGNRDIILQKVDGELQRIDETHPNYMPLQCPLLFPYGTDGWRVGIPKASSTSTSRTTVTMRQFYAIRIHDREEEGDTLIDSGRLLQQFDVDAYAAMEQYRLSWIRRNQGRLRSDLYSGLQDAIRAGDDNKKFGKVIADFYVIEFQNRGLPHAHILITLTPKDKPKCPEDIDVIISAEIPDKDTYLWHLKQLPRTCSMDHYRRRQNREPIIVNGRAVDNRWVVPYNRDLCVKYNAHNNVERVAAKVWWAQRQERPCIGRLPFVHPNSGERYYLRILLTKVCGEESFEDIQTVDGVIHPTFRSACHALGLLDDDNEWHETLSEASSWALGSQLRNMFCSILMFSKVSDPKQLWEQHWGELTDDLERIMQRQTRNPNIRLTPEEMQNQGLQEIEHILNKLGRSLTYFPDMPQPSSELARNALNRLIRDELEYDTHDEANRFDTLVRGLNTDQYRVYAAILDAHSRDVGGLFFVYDSGGTGKTYLWNTQIAKFRSKRKIVLSMASSRIAALLLSGGETAHSTFKIPFDLDQHSVCNFKKDSTRVD
uniref:ATP-dependent DNA helicase n=1 Tax=Chenopodium quinoa TaxID=63459 RepID=A0A803N417_CHEQI